MKWKNEMPNKTEFMKINSFNFIECEKLHSELVHEKNAKGQQEVPTRQDFPMDMQERIKTLIENRTKLVPARIKLNQNAEFYIEKVDKNVRVRTMSETITITKTDTDFTGSAPKRYTTKCFIQPVSTPIWYRESLLLKIGSTKKNYNEHVFFKEKFRPIGWSESMSTEVKTTPKCITSEFFYPIDDYCDDVQVVSLIPQQVAAESTDL